jgi:hypothetical protein
VEAGALSRRRHLGPKRKACLFRSSEDHHFHSRRIHTHWASLPKPDESWPAADLRIYYLRMIDPADRLARVERYRRLDPDLILQPRGYDYLLDEEGLELRDIEPGGGYTPPFSFSTTLIRSPVA